MLRKFHWSGALGGIIPPQRDNATPDHTSLERLGDYMVVASYGKPASELRTCPTKLPDQFGVTNLVK